MFDSIFYVINQLAGAAWRGMLGIYDLRPVVAITIFIIIGAVLWAMKSSPRQNIVGMILVIATFIVIMPSGISTSQEIIRQDGLVDKYDCLSELATDYKYWTGEKDSSLVCKV